MSCPRHRKHIEIRGYSCVSPLEPRTEGVGGVMARGGGPNLESCGVEVNHHYLILRIMEVFDLNYLALIWWWRNTYICTVDTVFKIIMFMDSLFEVL